MCICSKSLICADILSDGAKEFLRWPCTGRCHIGGPSTSETYDQLKCDASSVTHVMLTIFGGGLCE